ncbi:MAG: AtpZ/AtpI family protein [Pseudobdellovibrionaceae bacterium]
MNKYIIFASIGIELVGIMMASIYLGQLIDKTYQTKGFGLIIFMFVGLASWLTHVVLLLRRFEKNDKKDNDKE